jgi:probable F420-dependent oxidoreductase
VSGELGVAIPFWLDRPDEEALEIALAAERAGLNSVWVGEMASFDAFALATAIGLRTERTRLTVGPLAVGVRSPVAIALGVASVATLTGRAVDVALGASSPMIVSGWHDRPWNRLAEQMRETALALRALFDGERVRGFRLRRPLPETTITIAAFGPRMMSVAARDADRVVLNLVTADHVADVRKRIDADGTELAVWVPAALSPGTRALEQLASQLAVYLGAPGYGEAFERLGFGALVEKARAGAIRAELAAAIPLELIARIAALGGPGEIGERVSAYHDAGADHVALVPSTAEDPAGRRLLDAIARQVVA